LVVVASMVQRARAAGDGEHALLPTEAAMGPAPTAPEGDWAQSGCGGRELRSMANVARMSAVKPQIWQGSALSRGRCGRDKPSPGVDVGGVNPIHALTWQGCA
jgi:hypothetical protein